MLEGEKTYVFWIGLLILAVASVGLFGILWMMAAWNGHMDRFTMLKQAVPVIVAGVVFILIGLYMMKSGVRKSFNRLEVSPARDEPAIYIRLW